jgi:transposase InsO family protein
MCRVLGVSASGYYYWLRHPVGIRASKQQHLLRVIKQIYHQSQQRYGSPRVTTELQAQGILASRPRVARLMQKAGLRSIVSKKYRVQTTDSNHLHPVAENLLNREFTASRPGCKWVSDLTYIRTGEGWLYLTAILDLYDRKVVGWALSPGLEAEATSVAAWQMATRNRPLSGSLLFHSDRGVQYACGSFRKQLTVMSVKQSMSRKGNCWDNAVAESFFKTLKTEMVYQQTFRTREQARLAVFEYIEVWYNQKRRHSALGYLTPCQKEKQYLIKQTMPQNNLH